MKTHRFQRTWRKRINRVIDQILENPNEMQTLHAKSAIRYSMPFMFDPLAQMVQIGTSPKANR